MKPLQLQIAPFTGNNPRHLSVYNDLVKYFILKQIQEKVILNTSGVPSDFIFSMSNPTPNPDRLRIIYYDTEGFYENQELKDLSVLFTVEENAVEYFKDKFKCPVFHLPLGYDPEVFYPRISKPTVDISFCGTLFDPRSEVLSWLEPLAKNFKIKLMIPKSWSSRLKNKEKFELIDHKEWFTAEEMITLFSSSKIILCINRSQFNRHSTLLNKTPGRVFSEVGLKRCVFIDDTRDISKFFIPNTEVVTYSLDQGKSLRDKLDYFLKNESARSRVASCGAERTLRDHSWSNRLSFLIETLQNL